MIEIKYFLFQFMKTHFFNYFPKILTIIIINLFLINFLELIIFNILFLDV